MASFGEWARWGPKTGRGRPSNAAGKGGGVGGVGGGGGGGGGGGHAGAP